MYSGFRIIFALFMETSWRICQDQLHYVPWQVFHIRTGDEAVLLYYTVLSNVLFQFI